MKPSILILAAAALAASSSAVLAGAPSGPCPVVLHDGADAPGFSISTGADHEPNAASAEDGKGIELSWPRSSVPFQGFRGVGEFHSEAGHYRIVVSAHGDGGLFKPSVSLDGKSVELARRNGSATIELELGGHEQRRIGILAGGWDPISVQVFRVGADDKDTEICANTVFSAPPGLASKGR